MSIMLLAPLCLALAGLPPVDPDAVPLLTVQCPDAIARLTWHALSEAVRAWRVSDVEIDVLCHPNGAGRIETRLQGQRAIAELPPQEFGGPERVVEVAEVQVDALMRALGRPRAQLPRWVLRVGAGARAVGGDGVPLTLSFQLDRRFGLVGERGLLRVGLGGSVGAFESAGRPVSVVGTSGFALLGARDEGRRFAVDGGLGMRAGFVVLEGASGAIERPRDAAGPWFGPILQGGIGWLLNRRGEVRLGLEAGYSFDGPVGQPEVGAGLGHDGGWLALELALSMAF